MEPVLVSTSCGGASWVVGKLPMPTNGPFELLGTAFIGSLQCFSSSTCNAVLWANFGGPGYNTVIDNVFMRTSDGGRSWNSSILPGQPAPSVPGASEIFV